VRQVEKAPVVNTIIEEVEREVIQPVIHREREQTEIHHITQPLHQREVTATQIHQATLPAEVRATIVERGMPVQEAFIQPTTTFLGTQRTVTEEAPIIEEVVRKNIINEVQPIIEKEVIQPHIVNVLRPIEERIIEAPVIVSEVLPLKEMPAQTAMPLGQGYGQVPLTGQGMGPGTTYSSTTTTTTTSNLPPGQ